MVLVDGRGEIYGHAREFAPPTPQTQRRVACGAGCDGLIEDEIKFPYYAKVQHTVALEFSDTGDFFRLKVANPLVRYG